jgi:DNA modification methylase
MIDSCYIGDVRDGLRSFIAAGVKAQTCVTSPPYWGLRDYGVDGQIGLESTPDEYVASMVEVFRLVRDVLADDGTLWLNLGDSYAAQGGPQVPQTRNANRIGGSDSQNGGKSRGVIAGLKPKDLCGIPWRVAFALQADGWFLRSDIIWSKPNPMPESVTDRPTKAHEYLFLLAKSERYYYDADAIKEPHATGDRADKWDGRTYEGKGAATDDGRKNGNVRAYTMDPLGRNRRTVWTVPTQPYSEAHFATFPPALIEPCIAAGSRVGDVVLDPFMGSGTVAQVAQSLGRKWLGCELNLDYVELQKRRAAQFGLALV